MLPLLQEHCLSRALAMSIHSAPSVMNQRYEHLLFARRLSSAAPSATSSACISNGWTLPVVALIFALSLLIGPTIPAHGQLIGFDSGTSLAGAETSASQLVDVDADGDLDYVLTGDTGSSTDRFVTTIFLNDGNGTLTEDASFDGTENGSLSAGDVDGDGDIDLLITGSTVNGGGSPVTRLYTNDGTGSFTEQTTSLPAVEFSDTQFLDLDQDGDLDLVISGLDASSTPTTRAFENDGTGSFSELASVSSTLLDLERSTMVAGDINDDGIDDLILTGEDDQSTDETEVYIGDGMGALSSSPSEADLPDLDAGALGLGDVDGNGTLDLMITGNANGSVSTELYLNDGSPSFSITAFNESEFDDVQDGSVTFGDFNSDGLLDVFISGLSQDQGQQVSLLYRNQGNGSYAITQADFIPLQFSTSAATDLDDDGELDLVLAGRSSLQGGEVARYYFNTTGRANVAPNAPTSLSSTLTPSSATLSWQAATDADPAVGSPTPSSSLQYNVYVQRADGSFVVSPASIIDGPNAGARLISNRGNAAQQTSYELDATTLAPGLYTWSVQSIDYGLAPSPFASSATFIVGNAVTLTDGSSFGNSVTPPSTDEPIGRFALQAEAAGSTLDELTVSLDQNGSGISEISLWTSTDDQFDPADDTEIEAQTVASGTVPPSVTFSSGLSESIPTTQQWFFVVADVEASGNGETQAFINAASDITITGATLEPIGFPVSLSGAPVPLPVELAAFNGVDRGNGTAVLTWRTLSETRNERFEIERRARKGEAFTAIGRKAGAGTTEQVSEYRFVDANLPSYADDVTYRLRQVDVDGTNEVIGETTVRRGAPDEMTLSDPRPNPVRSTATVTYNLPKSSPVTVRVYDLLGREVASVLTGKTLRRRGTLMIDTQGLSSGMYFVRMESDFGVQTTRMSVVR